MSMTRKARILAPGVVLLAFVGLWIGHALEYGRVAGTSGLTTVLRGSVHAYMLPVGLLLAVLATVAGAGWARTWLALGRRLDDVRAAVAGAWRGRRAEITYSRKSAPLSISAGALLLWTTLTALQVFLYLVQENVEAASAGIGAPGLRAVTGLHWAAPLVHAGVALVLSVLAVLIGRLISSRAQAVEACESLLRALLRLLGRPLDERPRASITRRPPLQRHGGQLWSRPPPLTPSS